MKFKIVSLALTISVYTYGCPDFSEKTTELMDSHLKETIELSKNIDVSDRVQYYLKMYNQYCKDNNARSNENIKLHKIKIQGAINEATKIKDRIKLVIKTAPPIAEIKRIEFLEKIANKDFINEEEVSHLIKVGKENAKPQEKTCSNINNYREPLKGNMRHQDGMGWCFAYTAADLLSDKYKKFISAIDISNSYQKHPKVIESLGKEIPASSFYSGQIAAALITPQNKGGVCLEEDVDSRDYLNAENSKLINDLMEIENFVFYKNREIAISCEEFRLDILKLFPNLKLYEIAKIINQANRVNILDKLIEEACNSRININIPRDKISLKTIINNQNNIEDIIKNLDQALESKNIAGIVLYNSIYTNPMLPKTQEQYHSNTVVARRFNKKTQICEYLLRDNVGINCYKGWNQSCENGNYWISRELLKTHIVDSVYIK